MKELSTLKVAIIHDWLIRERGGEKVFNHIARLFPQADIYTLFYRKHRIAPELANRRIFASVLQHIPGIEKIYQYLLPLFPFLIERFDMRPYDLIISSSHCVAKGVRKRAGALHLCFCHTPMRYAWMFQKEYLHKKFYAPLAFRILNRIKKWDFDTSQSVDYFAANSKEVQNRILNFYNRKSDVIYPPLDLGGAKPEGKAGDYFLIVSALVRYKRIDLAVEAFNDLGLPLKIIGTGPCEKELHKSAKSNIQFLGWADNETLNRSYLNAKALVFPGHEDFGITPLEAQAYGKPVIAYGRGGVTETVNQDTGVFFMEQNKESLKDAVVRFQQSAFEAAKIREHALAFSGKVFDQEFSSWVQEKLQARVIPERTVLSSQRKLGSSSLDFSR